MAAFKLGKMTFGSLFKKPETVLYPIQVKEQPPGLKGHIALEVEDCILCGMCDRSCPTSCITVDKKASTWSINRYSCIQCGYCVTVCPKKCLVMEPGYAPAATKIEQDVFDVPVQDKKKGNASSAKNDAVPAAGKSKAQDVDVKPEKEAVTSDSPVKERDAVLESKIAIMEPDKAAKVRMALGL